MRRECPIFKKKTAEERCPECGMYLADCTASRVQPGTARPAQQQAQQSAQQPAQASPAQKRALGCVAAVIVAAVLLARVVPLIVSNWDDHSLAEVEVVTEQEIKQGEGWLGDYYMRIVSADRGKSAAGEDCVIVSYEWENSSATATSFYDEFWLHVVQEDTVLTWTWQEIEEVDRLVRQEVPPGEALALRSAYLLEGEGSNIYVEIGKQEYGSVECFFVLPDIG